MLNIFFYNAIKYCNFNLNFYNSGKLLLEGNMPLFSADLTVIKDSFSKITNKILRDFVELENLQSSQRGTMRFSDMTIEFIKKVIFESIKDKKKDWDIIFFGDSKKLEDFKSNTRLLVVPICGKLSFAHSIPYFVVAASLQKKTSDGNFETVCGIIDSPSTNETFIAEKNRGAFVNDRRIRVSARSSLDESIVAVVNTSSKKFIVDCFDRYKNVVVNGCNILNICWVSAGKYDIVALESKNPFLELPLLLFKEAGGLVKENDDGSLILSNEQLISQL